MDKTVTPSPHIIERFETIQFVVKPQKKRRELLLINCYRNHYSQSLALQAFPRTINYSNVSGTYTLDILQIILLKKKASLDIPNPNDLIIRLNERPYGNHTEINDRILFYSTILSIIQNCSYNIRRIVLIPDCSLNVFLFMFAGIECAYHKIKKKKAPANTAD